MAKPDWWKISNCQENWSREMYAHYKLGLEDGKLNNCKKIGLTFQGCYEQGYDHGTFQRREP